MNAHIDGFEEMKKEELEIISRNSRRCKGANCEALDGISHSNECEREHDEQFSEENGGAHLTVPSCFDRAEHQGRVFDNCRYFQTCKQRKPICVNNPLK